MAEILETVLQVRRVGPKPLYPWDEWLDGKTRMIKRGHDYTVKSASMAAMLRNKARNRGKRITIANYGNQIVFRAHSDATS